MPRQARSVFPVTSCLGARRHAPAATSAPPSVAVGHRHGTLGRDERAKHDVGGEGGDLWERPGPRGAHLVVEQRRY